MEVAAAATSPTPRPSSESPGPGPGEGVVGAKGTARIPGSSTRGSRPSSSATGDGDAPDLEGGIRTVEDVEAPDAQTHVPQVWTVNPLTPSGNRTSRAVSSVVEVRVGVGLQL